MVSLRRDLSHAVSFLDNPAALRILGLADGHRSAWGVYPSGALGSALSSKRVESKAVLASESRLEPGSVSQKFRL